DLRVPRALENGHGHRSQSACASAKRGAHRPGVRRFISRLGIPRSGSEIAPGRSAQKKSTMRPPRVPWYSSGCSQRECHTVPSDPMKAAATSRARMLGSAVSELAIATPFSSCSCNIWGARAVPWKEGSLPSNVLGICHACRESIGDAPGRTDSPRGDVYCGSGAGLDREAVGALGSAGQVANSGARSGGPGHAGPRHEGVPMTTASRSVTVPDQTITDYVLRHCARLGDKPALIDGPSGRTLSYRQLADAVRRAAAGLAARGFKKGDVLAIYSPNLPEYGG